MLLRPFTCFFIYESFAKYFYTSHFILIHEDLHRENALNIKVTLCLTYRNFLNTSEHQKSHHTFVL